MIVYKFKNVTSISFCAKLLFFYGTLILKIHGVICHVPSVFIWGVYFLFLVYTLCSVNLGRFTTGLWVIRMPTR